MTPWMLATHRLVGLVAGAMILVAAGTAIALNHQDVFRVEVASLAADAGPYGRSPLAVAKDPYASSRVLMGTVDGLFRSTDGGRSWQDVVLPVPAEVASAIAFDPHRPGVVYVGLRGIGVYRSEDAGEIWEEVALPFNPIEGAHLTGLSLDGAGRLLLATPEGLYAEEATGWSHVPAAGRKKAEESSGLVQLVYDLHDGRFWGAWGVPITDGVSLALIVLVLSGYGLYAGRWWRMRAAKRRARPKPAPMREAALR